jgi:hypothetical protein
MEELKQIPYGQNIRLASFDIKNMYTNIPTLELPKIKAIMCIQHDMSSTYTQEITQLMNLILKQNSFSFQNTTYIQKQGLGMGAPTSSILSEIFLQYMEHTKLVDILTQHQILGYFRYVDDVLLVHDATLTDIHTVLNNFNDATSPLQFTLEEEVHQQISFLDIDIYIYIYIYSDTHHFTYGIYHKHTTTDTIIPMTSCHPSEHKRSTIRYLQNRVFIPD